MRREFTNGPLLRILYPSTVFDRDAVFSEDVQSLGELGVVSVVAFETLAREDTGNYTCTASNSLPGGQTGTEVADSQPIPLTVLGKVIQEHTAFSQEPFLVDIHQLS